MSITLHMINFNKWLADCNALISFHQQQLLRNKNTDAIKLSEKKIANLHEIQTNIEKLAQVTQMIEKGEITDQKQAKDLLVYVLSHRSIKKLYVATNIENLYKTPAQKTRLVAAGKKRAKLNISLEERVLKKAFNKERRHLKSLLDSSPEYASSKYIDENSSNPALLNGGLSVKQNQEPLSPELKKQARTIIKTIENQLKPSARKVKVTQQQLDKGVNLASTSKYSKKSTLTNILHEERKASYFHLALTNPGAHAPEKTMSDWPEDFKFRTTIFVNHAPIIKADIGGKSENSAFSKMIPNALIREFILNHTHQDGYLYTLPTIICSYFFGLEPPISLINRSCVFSFEVLDHKQVAFKLITHHAKLHDVTNQETSDDCNITFAHKGVIKLEGNKVVIDNASFEYDPKSNLADKLAALENYYNTHAQFEDMRNSFAGKATSSHLLTRRSNKLKTEFDSYQKIKSFYDFRLPAKEIATTDSHGSVLEKINNYQQHKQQAQKWINTQGQTILPLTKTLDEQLTNKAKTLSKQLAERITCLDTAIQDKSDELRYAQNSIKTATNHLQRKYNSKTPFQLTKNEQLSLKEKKSYFQSFRLKFAKIIDRNLIQRAKLKHTLINANEEQLNLTMERAHLQSQKEQLTTRKNELELQHDLRSFLKPFKRLFAENTQVASDTFNVTHDTSLIFAVQAFKTQHDQLELEDLLTKIQNLENCILTQYQEKIIGRYWNMEKSEQNQRLLVPEANDRQQPTRLHNNSLFQPSNKENQGSSTPLSSSFPFSQPVSELEDRKPLAAIGKRAIAKRDSQQTNRPMRA